MVPLTSNLKKVHLASHYVLQDAFFLKRVSMVLGEQIDTIDKHRLHTFLGRLSEKGMAHTAETVREHLGFYCIMSFSCIESLLYEMLRFLICKGMVQK